ncbi:hypothetical protein [Roseateles flavus]|uniref:Uncharacterized protein n=1 Tax=Roseateles flavus TaxID=3149041 RepID=A0ABV0GG03_9BURK
MESQELIDAFRAQLDEVESQGAASVQVSALRSYLSALERDAAMSKERRAHEHAGYLAHYAAQSSFSIAMLEAVVEAGKTALQSLIVINGGAVIALLGVLGNLAGKPEGGPFARYLALPLLEFGGGVLFGALGFAFRYFSQDCYAEQGDKNSPRRRWGHRFRYAAILCAVLGFVLFAFAVGNSYNAVSWSFTK